MTTAQYRLINFSVVMLPFIIILTSMLCVESVYYAFLAEGQSPLNSSNLIVMAAAAILAAFLIGILFRGNRQFLPSVQSMEPAKEADDWASTFNTMTDLVSVHDSDFKVIRVNQALCDFLGMEPEQIIGRYCYQVFHGLDEPYAQCLQLKTRRANQSVTEIIDEPHMGVPLQITCSPLLDKGILQGSVHIARPVVKSEKQGRRAGEMIPICASCKNIRNGSDEWIAPEEYFIKHCDSNFTHTICRDCQKKLYPRIY